VATKIRTEATSLDAFVVAASDALVGTDQEGRILLWNQVAADLFGYPATAALGMFCHSLLRGRDCFGNAYCTANCNILQSIRKAERVHDFELTVRRYNGEWLTVEVSITTLRRPGEDEVLVLHLFRPVHEELERLSSGPELAAFENGSNRVDVRSTSPLSGRELEVLQLLADGLTTAAVAERLEIRQNTVRNHIQNAFSKLDVHSRAEAVAVALRQHLIPPVPGSTSAS
jgi:PAS domain S-box-containing protein